MWTVETPTFVETLSLATQSLMTILRVEMLELVEADDLALGCVLTTSGGFCPLSRRTLSSCLLAIYTVLCYDAHVHVYITKQH